MCYLFENHQCHVSVWGSASAVGQTLISLGASTLASIFTFRSGYSERIYVKIC